MNATLKDIQLYNLFTERFLSSNSVIKPPAFELVKRIYQRELNTITKYYNERVFAVRSNHLLCRLLDVATVPFSYDLDRYAEVAYARSPYVAKYFNFTSSINYGRLFEGVFYGEGNSEIIIYNEDYFNPYEALENWKTLSPIRVLEHKVSDFGLMLPNGANNSTGKGLVVVTINIPMLLIQYRGFIEEQALKMVSEDGSRLSNSHFVHMYVLPGMLKSHIDIVLLNRFKNLLYGAPMSEPLKHHPFLVVDYSDKTDKVLEEILKHTKDTRKYYYSDLKCLPSFTHEDMQDSLIMPNIPATNQAWWAMLVTRLSTMKMLLDLGGDGAVSMNRTDVNKLKIELNRLVRNNVLHSMLPDDLRYDVMNVINEILEL